MLLCCVWCFNTYIDGFDMCKMFCIDVIYMVMYLLYKFIDFI